MASNKVSIRLPEMPQVEIKIHGEWQKADALINGMAPEVLAAYHRGATRCSKALVRIIRRAIKTGLPPGDARWPALAKSTIKSHGKHNIYHLSGLYGSVIGLRQYKNRTVIGVPINMKVPNTDLTLNQLGIILEHGSAIDSDGDGNGIPKRPLWAPAFKEYGGVGRLKVEILRDIRRGLIARFHLRANQIRQTK